MRVNGSVTLFSVSDINSSSYTAVLKTNRFLLVRYKTDKTFFFARHTLYECVGFLHLISERLVTEMRSLIL